MAISARKRFCRYRRIAAAWLALVAVLACGPASAGGHVDPGTLTGKLIMGYQGWFGCPDDGARLGWWHWGDWSKPEGPIIDMLPDVSDLPRTARCESPMRTADGSPIYLFSDRNPEVIDRHFAWMQQYGLDGVALQRFAVELRQTPTRAFRDIVLANVQRAAENHGRVFFVMYDLSGLRAADLDTVAQDWGRLQRDGVTRSPAYLHHRGHPVLGIWGLGFPSRRFTSRQADSLLAAVAAASEPYGGVTTLGGVPPEWRTLKIGASPGFGWESVWRRLGVISPWSVGMFSDDAGADKYRFDRLEPDLLAARALGVDYMPVVFPGFSWANLQRRNGRPDEAVSNRIPRRCGRFYWHQVYNAVDAGASMIYGAMFDEVNEATAMFKLLPRIAGPVRGTQPGASFVALDADGCNLPGDWYLRLAGAATAVLQHGARPSPVLPLSLPAN